MNPEDEDRDVFQSHCFDPFPQPQTIPAGWDTDAILTASVHDSVQHADDSCVTGSN
jgi:hypothetical protein